MRFSKRFVATTLAVYLAAGGMGQALAAQYTVKSGDSLYSIGQRYHTSPTAIKSTNGLKSDTIYPSQILNLPGASNNYIVQSGDSLYSISKRFQTTINNLKNLNGLTSDKIYPGQSLKVPAVGGGTSYTVRKGDTLYLLAQKFGTSVASIKSSNNLTSDALYVGQRLVINGSGTGINKATTASRGASSYSRSEVLLLARLIHGEARGEVYQGQVAVGAVVLNRVASALFPNSISGVIYQKNEFCVVNDGQINLSPSETAIKAAEETMNGSDPSKGAIYYWNPVKAPNNKFLNNRPIVAKIGNHVFAQ